MVALIDEPLHLAHAVEKAEAEGFKFQSDIDSLCVGIIADAPASLDGPAPLRFRGDHLALPDVFPQYKQHIAGPQLGGEIEVALDAIDVIGAYGIVEIDQSRGDDHAGNDGETGFAAGVGDEPFFFRRDRGRFGENIDGVEPDAGNVPQPCRGVDAGLAECAVDDS